MAPLYHPLNYLNHRYYSTCPEAFTTSGLADFLTSCVPVQEAIYQQIHSLFPNRKKIRLKEICAGAINFRWQYILSEHKEVSWDITLTDFTINALPPTSPIYHTEIENIFDPLQKLVVSQKFDIILTTYGFDSVWFTEDRHYKKINTHWYKAIFKKPKKPLVNNSISNLSVYIPIITYQSINIFSEPYGREIYNYYKYTKSISFNFPGGMINDIQKSFSYQLKPTGVFITGDKASQDNNQSQQPFETIGKVAKFQTLDYGIAKYILTSLGYKVNLFSLSELLSIWNLSFPLDLF